MEENELATQDVQANDEPQDLRSVLESAFEAQAPEAKPAKPRDESGRFAKQEPVEAPKEAPKEPIQQEMALEPEKPAEPVKKAPSSWKKDAAEAFNTLPPHVQDEILRRETDFHKGIEGWRGHAEFGRSMEQAVKPFMQDLQQMGVQPAEAFTRLMNAERLLRTSPPDQKHQFFAQLARDYGVDLGQAQNIPQPDPYISQLEQKLQMLERQQTQWLTAQQQREMESLNSEISRFASDPSRTHFEAVREDMAALLQTGRAKDLQEAYDMAVYANPQTRTAMLELQRQEALKQAQSQALSQRAKAAAVSVKGSSPASGTAGKPQSLRAALEAAFDGN